MTVCDVALCSAPDAHINTARRWAGEVWEAWSPHHADVAEFAACHLELA